MPVPIPTETDQPRRLLRDVVFDKMLDAIMDGTLEPSERLNDQQLVAWLGVSRTPIREAIAKLAQWGLVEMEANRYTRIAARDPHAFEEASRFLTGLHDLALTWDHRAPLPTVTGAVKSAAAKIERKDVAGPLELLDAYGALVAATGNSLFIETELPLRMRTNFLSPADVDAYDWSAVAARADRLSAALKKS